MPDGTGSQTQQSQQSQQSAAGAGSQAASGQSAGYQSQQQTKPDDQQQQQQQAQAPQRPEGLPDDYWDADKGVKWQDFLGKFNDMTAREAERTSQAATAPAKPEDYKFELPKDFQLPDGAKVEFDANDPMYSQFAKFAHERGWSQDDFSAVLGMAAQRELAGEQTLNERLKEEFAALGEKGKDRLNAVETWLIARLGADRAKPLVGTLMTKDQVEAYEQLMALFSRQGGSSFAAGGRESQPNGHIEGYDKMGFEEKMMTIRSRKDQGAGRAR